MALHVRGVLLPDDEVRDIYLVDDRVTFEPVPGARTIAGHGFVLPGLVDAHCHIGILPGGAPAATLDEVRQLAGVDRDAGVLALRDAGSPLPYPDLDGEESMPRLARAGRHLAPPKKHLKGIPLEVTAEELPAAAAEQARLGNGWVKLVADWLDRDAEALTPTYDEAALRAAVEVAHAAGVRIAAHTFAEDAVATLVDAGVDSVEHGMGLTDDLIAVMAGRGTALVPTLLNMGTLPAVAGKAEGKFPSYADHLRKLHARAPEVLRAAYQAGVPIFVGTDAGGGVRHGMIADEMLLLHQAGMAPVDVLGAASWRAREWLGFGGLTEGGPADLIVYEQDPRLDLDVVRAPARIVLRGRVLM